MNRYTRLMAGIFIFSVLSGFVGCTLPGLPAPKMNRSFNCCIGCIPVPMMILSADVSGNEKLWYGYGYKKIYELRHDMFLEFDTMMNFFAIVPPTELTKGICTLIYEAPRTTDEYAGQAGRWQDVRGIIGKGTRIRCARLIRYVPFGLGVGDSLYVFAEILDGPFAGKEAEIADLSLLGPEKYGVFLLKPNPDLIRLVNEK